MKGLSRSVRAWLGRPAREQAPALLAAAVGLLVLGAIIAVAGRSSDEAPPADVMPAPAPLLGRDREVPPPEEDGSAQESLDAADQTALAFLNEYLPFSYGQGPLPTTGLTDDLRDELRRERESRRARVPPAAQLELRPRVVRLDLSGKNPDKELEAVALVEDGSDTRYPIEMTLRPVGGVWRVTDLGD